MELPCGLTFERVQHNTRCLKLIKNLHGQKQANRVWNEYLVKGLIERGVVPSKVDECVFYKGKTILLIYIDDGLSSNIIDDIITSLKDGLDVSTDEEEIDDCLESRCSRPIKDTIKLRQLHFP
jgi:hypothetical protein